MKAIWFFSSLSRKSHFMLWIYHSIEFPTHLIFIHHTEEKEPCSIYFTIFQPTDKRHVVGLPQPIPNVPTSTRMMRRHKIMLVQIWLLSSQLCAFRFNVHSRKSAAKNNIWPANAYTSNLHLNPFLVKTFDTIFRACKA